MEELSRMTLEEIAKEIGISRTTIYKVLRNKGHVSDRTRSIVNEALEKYHYVQNRNARNLAMNRQYNIGYIGFKSKSANYFSAEVNKGIRRAVKEFGDDGLSMLISEFDVENPGGQAEAVDEMLALGVESFILAYSHEDVMQQILNKLKEKKCLIVLLSRDYKENNPGYYVGVDYYKSGRLAAELLTKMVVEGGEVLVPVTKEYTTNQDIAARLKGFEDKMKEYGKLQVLPAVHGLLEEDEIYVQIVKSVKERPSLKGIFDLTYRLDVISKALKDLGREDIKLIGFDLFEEIRGYVEDSTIDAVVYQDLNQQAYQAVKLLFDEMCYGKRKGQQKNYAKLEVIMKENIQYF